MAERECGSGGPPARSGWESRGPPRGQTVKTPAKMQSRAPSLPRLFVLIFIFIKKLFMLTSEFMIHFYELIKSVK